LKIAFFLTALLILISNIDDAFVDLYYLLYKIRRKLLVYPKYRAFRSEDIISKKEQYFAIMIPAWQESPVIKAMLANMFASYNYKNYHVFVGCYPNDPDTITEIKKLQPHHKNLHISRLSTYGPTSKADCLNKIYDDICAFENEQNFEFSGYILHDAEDIVHPLELKLYNHLIPRKDMVQIPVIPLERPWYDLTGGHYQDEFAENHIKEMVVRESLTGHVPSAGVGTVLSRRALKIISSNDRAPPFDTGNLTEDYDLALRLKKHGLKLIFARFKTGPNDIIATREFFPNTVKTVVRQKSRWLMGIAFQGWRSQRWQGPLALKYALFRDRKGIFTAPLSVAAYFIMINILIVWLIEWLIPDGYRYPPLLKRGEPLEYILWANLLFLINRGLHRFYFTCQIYGLLSAALSFPRQLWGNILNFLAALRAISLYSGHILFDKPLLWDKTAHIFPEPDQLLPYQRKIGELLLEYDLLSIDVLQKALAYQAKTGARLGKILIDNGHITDQQLSFTLERQAALNDPKG